MRSRMIVFSSLSKANWALARYSAVGLRLGVARVLDQHLLLDGLGGVLAGELVLTDVASSSAWPCEALISSNRLESACGTVTSVLGLPAFSASSR